MSRHTKRGGLTASLFCAAENPINSLNNPNTETAVTFSGDCHFFEYTRRLNTLTVLLDNLIHLGGYGFDCLVVAFPI